MYSKVKKPRYILQSIGRFKTIITSASVNWRPLLHKSSCPRCLSRTGTIWSSGGTLDACSEKTACPREHFVLYLLLLLSQSLRSCCLTGPLLPLETAVLSADLFMDSSPEIFIRVTAIYCLYDCPNEYKSTLCTQAIKVVLGLFVFVVVVVVNEWVECCRGKCRLTGGTIRTVLRETSTAIFLWE